MVRNSLLNHQNILRNYNLSTSKGAVYKYNNKLLPTVYVNNSIIASEKEFLDIYEKKVKTPRPTVDKDEIKNFLSYLSFLIHIKKDYLRIRLFVDIKSIIDKDNEWEKVLEYDHSKVPSITHKLYDQQVNFDLCEIEDIEESETQSLLQLTDHATDDEIDDLEQRKELDFNIFSLNHK